MRADVWVPHVPLLPHHLQALDHGHDRLEGWRQVLPDLRYYLIGSVVQSLNYKRVDEVDPEPGGKPSRTGATCGWI